MDGHRFPMPLLVAQLCRTSTRHLLSRAGSFVVNNQNLPHINNKIENNIMVDIKNILQAEPTLTPFGVEGPNTMHTRDKFDQDYLKQIDTCMEWLKTKAVTSKMNRKTSSYGIKHVIEHELDTYVSNGCFIAAIISLSIPYEKIPDSPNIFAAISCDELSNNE